MGTIKEGAKQVVVNCLKINPDEKVVMISDIENNETANAIKDEILKIVNEKNLEVFVMEDFGKRSEDGTNSLHFPLVIGEALVKADVSIYCASGKKGELQTFRKPMLSVIDDNKKLRHGHMIGITKEIMMDGMCSDYDAIQKLSAKVYDIVSKAKKIRVTNPAGTDFTAEFSPNLKWIVSDGNLGKGSGKHWSNLPDGEVFTCPIDVNGKVIIDGCLGDFFGKYGEISKNPVHMTIENGRVVNGSVTCKDKNIEKELNEYIFCKEENTDRIGEFAIGTNLGLTKIIGNLLQDEKFPGVHIAWGDSYGHQTGADWQSPKHCDGVIKNTTIEVDGKVIMKEGKYLI